MELYQEHHDKLLQTKEIQEQDEYGLAVYATWKLSYDKLGSSVKTLMEMLSFLHHEGIREEIFKRASLSAKTLDDVDLQIQMDKLLNDVGKENSKWNSFVFQKLMGQIKSYSLIEFDEQNQCYGIHPLVQHWSAWTLNQRKNNIQKCVLGIIGISISLNVKGDDYKYQQIIVPHISSCISAFKPQEIDVLIAKNIAYAYWENGHWKEAEALEVVVMEESKHALGEEHPDTLTSMANLAVTYWKQGQWKEAEALQVVVMEKSKHILGEEHPDTLRSMRNLALTYWKRGQWKEAEALQVMVMEKSKHILGEEHPDTLRSMANIAVTYSEQG